LEIAVASPLEGTRLKILAIIREGGAATVEQLAQETNLSSATIRRHLDILQRDHLVSYRESRKQLGRPEFVYSLTEAGQEAGFRNYQALLTLLLSIIKEQSSARAEEDGGDFLAFLMLQVADCLTGSVPWDGSTSQDSRIARLQKALSDNGFDPLIDRVDGQVEVRLCNCPFRAVALCEEAVCLSDQRLIANILGVEPLRQASIREGDPLCCYTAQLDD
jgi:predicted ArsR family transcriptional regulator